MTKAAEDGGGVERTVWAHVTVAVQVRTGPWSPGESVAHIMQLSKREARAALETALQSRPDIRVQEIVQAQVVCIEKQKG